MAKMPQIPLIGLSLAELSTAIEATGLEAKPARMRARQLWNWIYVHGARDFGAMTNIAQGVPRRAGGQFHARAALKS